MSRAKGSKNTRPAMDEMIGVRLPSDIVEWLDRLGGSNRSSNLLGVLRAARATNLQPYFPTHEAPSEKAKVKNAD